MNLAVLGSHHNPPNRCRSGQIAGMLRTCNACEAPVDRLGNAGAGML
jgi:hypothetical protein